MNLKYAFLAVILVFAAVYAEAMELGAVENPLEQVEVGQLQVAGTACVNTFVSAPDDLQVLILPLSISLKKTADKALARGTCMISLPIKVKSGYRLVLSDLSAEGVVNLRKGSKSRVDLEIFKAGEKGQVQSALHDASNKRVREDIDLSQAGEVFSLGCGESGILRGNAAILLQGSARATASLFTIGLRAKVEACD